MNDDGCREAEIILLGGRRSPRGRGAERLGNLPNVGGRRRLVQRDADAAVAEVPEVHARCECRRTHPGFAIRGHDHAQRVEVCVICLPEPGTLERPVERPRVPVHATRDRLEAFRPVVHRVHRRDVREQRLRRADVRRRLFPADVLFARLQRHAVRAVAVRVDRHADDPPRRLAGVLLARGEERRVRAAVPHRHPEPLRVADDDVRAHLARGREERERQQIGRHGHLHPGFVRAGDDPAEILRTPFRVGILQQQPELGSVELHARRVHDTHLEADRLRAAHDHVDRLGKSRR
jgi:hypothetical protein